ncbi:MAG: sulfoxide reductase heme-binding subunit YedZ [Gemmatimonadaceae bacterium]|nr:sulfoxide reductase heme-binding subunit YedZ [Gemmatimonadaceae bacterium]
MESADAEESVESAESAESAPAGALEARAGGAARGAPPENHTTPRPPSPPNQNRALRTIPPRWLHALVLCVATLPFLYVAAAIASDFFQGTRFLGSNPIKEAEHFTGKWTLRFLALSLVVTPAVRLLRAGWLIRYRRTFGLIAFAYACTHLVIYAALDVELTWRDMVEDVAKRLYITIGMMALALLVPLAVTSTKGWIRRLGNRRWSALHRLVYASAVLGLVHYWMSVKKDVTEPAIFALVFAVLLGWRVRRWAGARHRSGVPGTA